MIYVFGATKCIQKFKIDRFEKKTGGILLVDITNWHCVISHLTHSKSLYCIEF